MNRLQKRSGLVTLIRKMCFQEKPSQFPEFAKEDFGPANELQQQRSKDWPDAKGPGVLVRHEDFKVQKRATVSTADGSAGDLVEDSIFPSIVPSLYQKTWSGQIGARFIRGLRGKFVLPGVKDKPASGFVSETADFPESSIDFEKATELSPLKVGTLQPVTRQSLIQDETMLLQNTLANEMQMEFAKKVDDDFLNGDASANRPRGVLEIAGIQSLSSSSTANAGAKISHSLLQDTRSLLEENNQYETPVFLINSKTAKRCRQILRAQASGAKFLLEGDMLIDIRALTTNLVKSDTAKGTSTANLSQLVCAIPQSIVVCDWYMPRIEIDFSLGFKSDQIFIKICSYLNIGLSRKKDVVLLKDIDTTAA